MNHSPLSSHVLLVAVLLVAASLESASAAEGPFGIHMRMPIKDIPLCKIYAPATYGCPVVPEQHPRFSLYLIGATPRVGACAVSAIGFTPEEKGDGKTLRAVVDEIARQISRTYGKPTSKIDQVAGISLMDRWVEEVRAGKRQYGYRWHLRAAPVNDVALIELAAQARSDPQLAVKFHFTNVQECVDDQRAKGSDAF